MEAIEGIVIRVYPSGDSDLVLKVVTREFGKLSLIAKHARKSRKRFGSSFDLFDRGLFEIRRGRTALATVSGFIPNTSFHHIRSDLNKLTAASIACECLDLLVKDETEGERDYFEIINLGLKAIEDAPNLRELLRAVYALIFGLLNFAGHLPCDFRNQPSANSLLKLIEILERVSEKQLSSRDFLFDLIKQLKRTDSSKSPDSLESPDS